MANLIVIVYPTEIQAEQVRLDFLKMQKEYLVSLEDAVIAVKKPDGKVKLRQMYNLALGGTVSGAIWGTLIGLIFMMPFFGLVLGAATGAVAGSLSDVGINDDFMKRLASTLKPGNSALFVLVDSKSPTRSAPNSKARAAQFCRPPFPQSIRKSCRRPWTKPRKMPSQWTKPQKQNRFINCH